MKKSFVLDTMIFNKILDEEIPLEKLGKSGVEIWATHVQEDELKATQKGERREELMKVFKESASKRPTESNLWDVSKWDQSKWPSDDLVEKIKNRLDSKNKSHRNNSKDSLIADTAMKNDFTLVTDEKALIEVVKDMGGKVINWGEFLFEI